MNSQDHTAQSPHPEASASGAQQAAGQEQQGSSSSGRDRFRDPFGGAGFSFKSLRDAMRDAEQQAEDAIYSVLPPDVTQHLMNSQKELLQASRRVGQILTEKATQCADRRMEELDRKAARAREVHERMKAEREAQKAAQQGPVPDAGI